MQVRTACSVWALLLATSVSAQQVPPPDPVETLRKEVQALSKTVDALKADQATTTTQADLQLIKALLQRLLAQTSAPASAADFECPFCGKFATEIYPQIDRDYIKEGRLRYMFVDYPIEQMHPSAFKAHEAALCAGEQGKYWEMHARLFANQKTLAPDALLSHAEAVGANGAKLQECLSAGRNATRVRTNVAAGRQIGVRGTPTFILGVVERGQFHAKRVLAGAQPYSVFEDAIDTVLTGK